MPKPTRTIVFVAADLPKARAAASVFSSLASRFGLSWTAAPCAVDDVVAPDSLTTPTIVAVDLPEYTIPPGKGDLYRLPPNLDLVEAVNGLLARLLGGNDQTQLPPSPPPPPKKIPIARLSRETAGRRGKGVTVVSDLPLTADQLKELATKLKTACGTGGTAKDGRIEIQGDQRDRLATELEKLGYKVKRRGMSLTHRASPVRKDAALRGR